LLKKQLGVFCSRRLGGERSILLTKKKTTRIVKSKKTEICRISLNTKKRGNSRVLRGVRIDEWLGNHAFGGKSEGIDRREKETKRGGRGGRIALGSYGTKKRKVCFTNNVWDSSKESTTTGVQCRKDGQILQKICGSAGDKKIVIS